MNNGVCLSLPLATRCFEISTLQAVGLLIPPCVEAICLSLLICSKRGRGRKPWFLLADAWLFALLNIAEFVPRLNKGFFPSLFAFEVFDRVLAGASAIPLLLFMGFLRSYARGDLLPILPIRYRGSLELVLLLCIPLVIILTEVAALLGFSYKVSSTSTTYRFWVDFTNDQARLIWSLLNSIALAVFIVYQASIFFLTGFRLSRHFVMERDESLSRRPKGDAMTIKGTGWLAAGIKLGAIETLLAFIPNGWELVFARRLCRLLGRIFILVGILKGLDQQDGFTLFRAASLDSIEGLPPRRIPLMDSVRDRVNSPPFLTFGRQSPTPYSLRGAPKAKPALPPSNLVDSHLGAGEHEDKRSLASVPIIVPDDDDVLIDFIPIARLRPARVQPPLDEQARVTLHYDGLRAPTLVLRFSALHLPSPGTLLAALKDITPTNTEPPSPIGSVKKDVVRRRAMSAYDQHIPNPFDDADTQSLQPLPLRRASTQVRKKRDNSYLATVATTAFDPEVRALANKFPSPPDSSGGTEANVTSKPEQGSQSGHDEDGHPPGLDRSFSGNSKQSSTRSNSTRRKPVPIASPAVIPLTPRTAQPPSMPRTSMEDQRKAQIRQQLRKNWLQSGVRPSAGAALRQKDTVSFSTATQTMGTSMAPSTPYTGMSFRDAIDSVYDPGYVVPLSEDRPVGRLADRAIEMEAYLDKEKEKRGINVIVAPRTLEGRKTWEQEQSQRLSSGVIAHRRPQGNINTEYPWVQKEDPVTGANADLEAAWKTATTTARTHDGVEHAGGEDHTVGQVKSLNRVTTRRQPVVRPVVHSVLSVSVEESLGDERSIGDQWSFVDPYASVVPTGMRVVSVPQEPDSPVDTWEPNPYIRP